MSGVRNMKAMLAGFAVMAVLTVGAWFALNAVGYTEAVRVDDGAVRLD